MNTVMVGDIEYRQTFGVPYAYARIVERREYKECPKCHVYIASKQRKDFESHSGIEYAEHYLSRHAQDDGWLRLSDGKWYEPVTK